MMQEKMTCMLLMMVVVFAVVARGRADTASGDSPTVSDKSWEIVTIEEPPYLYHKEGEFTGFVPDLFRDISKRIGFSYKFHLSRDGEYGSYNHSTDTWNGMIGEVLGGQADMAAAPITITRKREQVLDFVHPFQNLGLTVLVKKPHIADDNTIVWKFSFSIVSPLEPELWALIIILGIVVAMVLWLLNRFNPYDYGSRLERGLSTEQEADSFSLPGALWFVFTTLQWQGYDRAPRSLASKFLGGIWFMFVTVTMVTYTASLVNHLFWASTVHGKDPTQPPVRDIEALIQSADYDYGTIRGGSTYKYLTEVAKGAEFDALRRYVASPKGQSMLVSNNSEGIKRVQKGEPKYAFIMESMTAKHAVNNPLNGVCDLMTVGGTFGRRSYGFALPENSTHVEEFHHGILDAIESGVLEYLEQKWWVDNGQCWNISRIEKMVSDVATLEVNKPKRVGLSMFWGALLMIVVGIIISILVCVGEMAFFKYRGRYSSSNRPRLQKLAVNDEPDANLE